MATEQPITDYTNRDYNSLLSSLLDLAAQKLPEWTDRSENDLGRLLLELFAYVGDELLYYQDRIANEAFLSTAVERRSVIDLLALIGYTLDSPAPASAELDLTLKIPNNSTDPISIDSGAQFATQAENGKPAVPFIYWSPDRQPLTIKPDELQKKITVINATQIDEELGRSTGEPNQSFQLAQRPVLLPRDSKSQPNPYLTILVGNEKWEKKEIFLESWSTNKDYIVRVNDKDEAEIVFGDGQYGKIPPRNMPIYASYLIGGGASGNVGSGMIKKYVSGIRGASIVTINNPRAASGGADRETIENARRQAPQVYRSLKRAVTEEDYVALAEHYPGVLRASAVAPSWNYVDLYVVTTGNLDLTEDLRHKLLKYFEDKRMVTTIVNVRNPVFVTININIGELNIESSFYQAEVQQRTNAALATLFSVDQLTFGKAFYISKVYEAIESVEGVASARLITFEGIRSKPDGERVDPNNAQPGLIQLQPREFPRLGTITFPPLKGGLI